MTLFNTSTMSSHSLLRRRIALIAGGGAVVACMAAAHEPANSQTHWLRSCVADEQCGSLECLCGVCTMSCTANSTCGQFGDAASCAEASGFEACAETSAAKICLPGCDEDTCGAGSECVNDRCVPGARGASDAQDGGMDAVAGRDASGVPAGGMTNAGGATDPGGMGGAGATSAGAADGGADCRVAHVDYSSGTTVPSPDSCGTCECRDGELQCEDTQPACVGKPIEPCPADVQSDSITVKVLALEADQLKLELGHSGGCERHDYALCYGEFLESSPVQVPLTLIHDSHDDGCEAYLTLEMAFDLSPLATAYQDAYRSRGGVVVTDYGDYAFGELSCQEREFMTRSELGALRAAVDRTCESDDDCVVEYADTECLAQCGTLMARSAQAEFLSDVESLSDAYCVGFEDTCGPVLAPPCAPIMGVCQDGVCTEG